MSLKAQLAKSQSLWKKAKDLKSEFESVVTDGVYVGKITKAELGTSESSGRLQVAWGAVISGGEFKGEKVNWWSGLKTEQNFMFLRRDLTRLGVDVPEDLSDLTSALKEVEKEKPSVRFKVKLDGEFVNVRLLKKLEKGADEEETDDTDAVDNTDTDAPDEPTVEEEAAAEEEVVVEEEAAAEEEQPSLEVGVRVAFDFKGDEIVGEVSEIDNKAEVAKVKGDNGKSYKGIKYDKLRPAPKAKVKKK